VLFHEKHNNLVALATLSFDGAHGEAVLSSVHSN